MVEDDRSLLQQFYCHGNDQALATFVERHRDWAVGKARRSFADEAEDIVQLSIVRLMDFEPVDGVVSNPLGLWATIIAATAMDQLRSHIRRRDREQAAASLAANETLDPTSSLEHQELLRAVLKELDSLNEVFKQPFIKRFFEGMSYQEVATALNCTTGTVGSRLSRTLAQIRKGLISNGIEID